MVSQMARSAAAALLTLFVCVSSLTDAAHLSVRGEVSGEVLSARAAGFNGCEALIKAGLKDILYFAGDGEYDGTLLTYYAKDVQDVKPTCILKPKTSKDVAKAIKELNTRRGRGFPVAVRSGGHAPYASNNVQDGVTIDLGRMNSVKYKGCKSGAGTAFIGAGARWGEVYAELEPKGIMVGGGREGHVGVGGFLLGGGFSWYSGKRGMCADDVLGYEVVLADGKIVMATATRNKDLFKALKGGLNNLGIVTRFDIRTFSSHDIYGGVMAFPWTQKEAVVAKFINMVDGTSKNRADTGFVSLSWSPGLPSPNLAFITANVDGVDNSTTFAGLKNLSPLVDYRMKMPLTGLTTQLASTLGLYQVWYTLTVHNTPDMGRKIIQVFDELVAELQGQIEESIQLIFVLTPLPKTYGDKGSRNILGLDKLKANSIVLQPEVILPSQTHQAMLQRKLRKATAEIEAYARRTRQFTDWLYINYANLEQNPLSKYGAANGNFLYKTAKKYDPSGYFQTSVAGEFKLSDLK
ncbi:FAD binding domain-containing protein [Podospora aff. communis PSN243]|uniref:FAD binding domain-containing protein n=1 Tax=Podospora aff. communis PSN243 TaxID=3040156 RepID=A0AAV9GSD9_9PEZI|nr:FAD binding domain-containing protein [Podospora aff. communis PSN243]